MAKQFEGISPLNVANITRHLGGIDFPANKNSVVEFARKKGATEPVITELSKLADREYNSMADVMQEYGRSRQKKAA